MWNNLTTFRCVSESNFALYENNLAPVCCALAIIVFIWIWQYFKWRIENG